jgi:hypothetical protein
VNDIWLPRPGRPGYEQRRLVVPPGAEHLSRAGEWADSLVILESGRLEVICQAGPRRLFEAGAMLWLDWLPLCALRSRGSDAAVLVAIRRCREQSVEPQSGTYHGRQW